MVAVAELQPQQQGWWGIHHPAPSDESIARSQRTFPVLIKPVGRRISTHRQWGQLSKSLTEGETPSQAADVKMIHADRFIPASSAGGCGRPVVKILGHGLIIMSG